MKKQSLLLLGRKFGLQLDNVEKILLKQTGLSREQFFLKDEINISESELLNVKELFRKVSFGYPLEYILEKAEFYGQDFYVDKRCLIPRDDTEIMVTRAIEEIVYHSLKKIVYIDVGTGSGAIPISVVDNIGQKIDKSYAVDISFDALEVAKINTLNHKIVDKLTLVQSDLLNELLPSLEGTEERVLVITANLPYIKDEDYGNMDKEVILHEPSIALYGGKKTGFEMYEKLIHQIFSLKKKKQDIILFIEIGFDQKEVAIDFFEKQDLEYEIFKDNSGVDRCIQIMF